MSLEYLGCRIKENPNRKEAPSGVLDPAHPDRREKGRSRQDSAKLVTFYGDIAQHRYNRFNLKRAKASNKKLKKNWKKLLELLEKARTYQDDVRHVNGKAVPIPSHFNEEELTLQEAETIALSILKQVMEEKVTPNNVDIAKVSPNYHLYTPAEYDT
uniref:Proteasome subunit alpha type n=1 Tax=Oryza nivara TaxID=4536 RepID=A0A0E0J499_ORYNI